MSACLALDVFLVFHAFILTVFTGLRTDCGILFDIVRIRCQEIRECATDRLHLVYLAGAFGQFNIAFLERHQAVSDAALALVHAIVCRIEYIG